MRTQDPTQPPSFPFGPGADGGPSPQYARLREAAPVSRVTLPTGHQAWLVTRREDIMAVLSDSRFSRETEAWGGPRFGPGASTFREGARLNQLDPPEHTRLRRVLQPMFARRRVEHSWRPRIMEIARAALQDMLNGGPPGDLVGDFATPLVIQVGCEVVGVPVVDTATFERWATLAVSLSPELPVDIVAEVDAFLLEHAAKARHAPGYGILAVLVEARDNGTIDDDELTNLARSVLLGGTAAINIITRGVLLFDRHPDQWRLLCAEPSRVPDAVDEILRYSPVDGAGLAKLAVATEDVTLSGTAISPGDIVISPLSAANRDPATYPQPDRFDINRNRAAQNLAFGHGRHLCVGSHLARIELECALHALLQQLPEIQLQDDELRWTTGTMPTKLTRLAISWREPTTT